jgi:hypothetical protein
MAASYIALGSHRDIQQLSDTTVVDIQRVAGLTQPSGIYFERVVPLTIFGTGAANDYVAELAEAIEQRIQGGIADTASWTQDTDANGLLVDFIEFVISIPGPPEGGGTFSTSVPVPVNLLTAGLGGSGTQADQMLDTALQQLRATAAA